MYFKQNQAVLELTALNVTTLNKKRKYNVTGLARRTPTAVPCILTTTSERVNYET